MALQHGKNMHWLQLAYITVETVISPVCSMLLSTLTGRLLGTLTHCAMVGALLVQAMAFT